MFLKNRCVQNFKLSKNLNRFLSESFHHLPHDPVPLACLRAYEHLLIERHKLVDQLFVRCYK